MNRARAISLMMFFCMVSCMSLRGSIVRKDYKVVFNHSEYVVIEMLDIEEVLEKKLSLNLRELYRAGMYISIAYEGINIDSLTIKKQDGTLISFYNEVHELNKKFKPNVKPSQKIKLLDKTIHAHKLMVWTDGK
ncbi:hypothetical protein [Saprospira grandis]|uniref:hypothetical protein n=1 Tax=Saprospira grandis TaxID=1008 RepID=UPI0022DD8C10|nr:hypothetical protein [Saprospira grandis]WBM74653.1 hypothetical protein OP864_00155 [Saprospira grandis]